jgi:hypothetical protein
MPPILRESADSGIQIVSLRKDDTNHGPNGNRKKRLQNHGGTGKNPGQRHEHLKSMNIFFFIFLSALLGLVVGAPLIENASGEDWIDTLAITLAIACIPIMLASGIVWSLKMTQKPVLRILFVFLVVLLTAVAFVTATLLM